MLVRFLLCCVCMSSPPNSSPPAVTSRRGLYAVAGVVTFGGGLSALSTVAIVRAAWNLVTDPERTPANSSESALAVVALMLAASVFGCVAFVLWGAALRLAQQARTGHDPGSRAGWRLSQWGIAASIVALLAATASAVHDHGLGQGVALLAGLGPVAGFAYWARRAAKRTPARAGRDATLQP